MDINAPKTALQRLLAGLAGAVARDAAAILPVTDFIYDYVEEDRAFSSEEYPSHPKGGLWAGCATPWIADILTVPPSWSWTPSDLAGLGARTLQTKVADAYVQENAPSQTYEGSAAQVLHQRYSKGMWSPAVFPPEQVEALVSHWVGDDAELARQRLGGANPFVIAKFRGSAGDLEGLIARSAGAHDKRALSSTLTSALARGGLFVCDYRPILGGVTKNGYVRAHRWFTVPIVFFALEAGEAGARLMPVAIQLDAPGDGYVFTPADDERSWLLSKLWAASADTQVWFSGAHIFRTHTVGAIFGIAALHQIQSGRLSASHPMITLMYPHLQKVFDINHFIYDAKAYARGGGRNIGIYQRGREGKTGFTDAELPTGRIGIFQIVNDLYRAYSFDDQAFDADMKARGVGAESLPIAFPYRDDAAPWWEAIGTFVTAIVEATYADDAAVAADAELCGWMALVEEAFNRGGESRFAWRATREGAAKTFGNMLFLCSAQHAAVNDSQFDQFAFLPNGAYAMTAPPPTGPGVTDEELLASLPDPRVETNGTYAAPILAQVGFSMAGTSSVSDRAAGDGGPASLHAKYPYPEGSAQHAAVARFYDALWTGPGSVRARIAANREARLAAFPSRPAPNSVRYPYLDVRSSAGDYVNAPVTSCIQI